jgi:hypothetical protein
LDRLRQAAAIKRKNVGTSWLDEGRTWRK